jgi:hypothetical protein
MRGVSLAFLLIIGIAACSDKPRMEGVAMAPGTGAMIGTSVSYASPQPTSANLNPDSSTTLTR